MMRQERELMQTTGRWFVLCGFGCFLSQAILGQTSPVPYARDSDGPGPTYISKEVRLHFPGRYSSIGAVNFRELIERREKSDPYDHYSATLDSVHPLASSPVTKQSSALILYSWSDAGGSSSGGGVALVFELTAGRLSAGQKIDWDTHFQAGEPTDNFDAGTQTLVIRSAHYIPGDAHCCVSAMDVVMYRWNGRRFIQSGVETQLSAYGKREGKTLPTAKR